MAFQIDENEFRRIEQQVLDPFHTSLSLYGRDRADARLAALAAFDGLALASAIAMLGGREHNASTRQMEKKFEDGLAQAMRWLTPKGHVPTVSPTLAHGSVSEAGDFLIHAADYANLVDFHRLYGAKLLLAEVDAPAKTVRFRYTSKERGFEAAMGFVTSADHELVRVKGGSEPSATINPNKPIAYDLVGGMIRLAKPENLAADDPTFTLPLPPKAIADDADLAGFSMKELAAYWKALTHWSSYCIMHYVRLALARKPQETCMPTQVIAIDQFKIDIAKVSGLAEDKVVKITERLSFDYRTTIPCIYQQPLLVDDTSVAWSLNLILHSRYDRNMLKLMARDPAMKVIADNLIGGRERAMLSSFGKRLGKRGWSYSLNKQLQHGTHIGELDLLGYTNQEPDTVAVCEWKSILTVDEVHEVRAATTELIAAQDQALDRIEILKKMSNDDKRTLYPFVSWDRVKRYLPFVVTQDVEPNETYDHAKVPCLCVDSLVSFGKGRHCQRPSRLSDFAATRPWHQRYADMTEEYEDVTIGQYIYQVPVLVQEVAGSKTLPCHFVAH
jgi:hypothetical protein